MTPIKFTEWAESVFGKYLTGMKSEVTDWLKPHDAHFISALRLVTLREHPSVYGKPPGVHELEEWKVEAYRIGHDLEGMEATRNGRPLIPQHPDDTTDAEARQKAGEFRRTHGLPPLRTMAQR